MPKTREVPAIASSKGHVVAAVDAAGDVRRLKGRLANPARPVILEGMSRAVVERRARISQS